MSKTNKWIYTDHKVKGNMQSPFFYILVTDINCQNSNYKWIKHAKCSAVNFQKMCKFYTFKAIENSKKKKTNGGLSCSCPPKLIYKYDSQSKFQQVFFFLRNWHADSNLNRIEKDLDYPKQFWKKNMPTTWYQDLLQSFSDRVWYWRKDAHFHQR